MAEVPSPGVSNEAVVATYDRLAAAYDRLVAPLQAGTRRRVLDLLAVAPGERVLEVGCGPGRGLIPLARRVGPGGRVVGLDAAPGMVTRARSRVERAGLADRVDLLLGDARSLPLAGDAFDVAFVEDTLELFPPGEMRVVLAELSHVLVPDGRLGVVTMEREGAEDDLFVRAYDWTFEHVPGYERFGCRPVYARHALEAAGFEIEHREHYRRALVWPVELLVGRPAP